MPVGEVLVDDVVEPDGMHRIGDVHQDAVARAGARRQTDFREDGDVVTLIGHARGLRPRPVVAALPETRDVAGRRIREDAGTIDDPRLLRGGERHLDDVDAEEGGVRIFFRILA